MSLFDFLTKAPDLGPTPDFSGGMPAPGAPMPVTQQPDLAPQAAPQVASGGLLQAAPAPHGPGLLERLRAPDETGISTLDKIGAAAAMLRNDAEPDIGYKLLDSKRKAFQTTKDAAEKAALKDKGNRAFRAAYQNGKFDAGTYASVMGDDLDPMDFAKLNKQIGPEAGESGGFGFTKNADGSVTWGQQRPPSYSDSNSFNSNSERARHDQVTEAQGAGHLAVAQGNAALARQREGRLGSKAPAGGASWLPPGAKIVHLPGS